MQQKLSLTDVPKISGARIGILYSKWYPECVESMVSACERALGELGVTKIERHRLPGSLEIPCAAKHLLQQLNSDYDALIAFGVIVKGETLHFEMITGECMRGIENVMLEYNVPILCEVLPVLSIDHARARSSDDDSNKGIEAAIAAAEIISWRREVRKRGERSLGF